MERTDKSGTIRATITENYFQENAYDDNLIINARPKSNGGNSKVEGDFYKPKGLCTATKLLSKTYRRNDAFNFYERSRNSKGKTSIRPGTSDQILSMNKSYKTSVRDLPSRSGCGDNIPPAISDSGLIEDIKDIPSSSNLNAMYKKTVTDCAPKSYAIKVNQRQSDAPPKGAQYPETQLDTLLVSDTATTSNRYDSLCKVLDLAKGADKIQRNCFGNFELNSFKRKLEVVHNVANINDQMEESLQKITAERHSIHKAIKEESIKNRSLISPTKGKGEGPNTAEHHLDTFYLDDEIMADYSAISSFAKKRKVEKSCNKGKIESLKNHLKTAKKNRCIPQSSETFHSSTSSPENKFRLVSVEDEYLTAADPSDIGDNGGLSIDGHVNRRQHDREGKRRKRKECLIHAGQYFEKQTATVDKFFDGINGLLFNTPLLEKPPRKPCVNHQRNYNSSSLWVTAPEAQSAHSKLFQGELIRNIHHGKLPLNQRRPAKNKSDYICPKKSPTAKSHSCCRKDKLHNEIINKNEGEGSKYEQADEISRSAKLTNRTFDLAGVFYEGILDNWATCGQGCPENSFRKTSENTKIGAKRAQNNNGKPLLKRLSAVGHSAAKNNHGETNCNPQAHNDDHKIEVLIKPTTSNSFGNFVNTKAATNSRNMARHITCTKGNGLPSAGQQGSFIDTVIETIITAKPSCNGDQKLLFVTNEEAMNSTKGIKRKNTIARFDNNSFKRGFPNGNNSKKASPQDKSELAKKNSTHMAAMWVE